MTEEHLTEEAADHLRAVVEERRALVVADAERRALSWRDDASPEDVQVAGRILRTLDAWGVELCGVASRRTALAWRLLDVMRGTTRP